MGMISSATLVTRTGCSDVPQESERVHALMIHVMDRPGAVDRVVGVLRRRRARLQSFNLSQSSISDIMRITALVKDTEVGVEHLFEQVCKIVDVQHAERVIAQDGSLRELVLVRVSTAVVTVEGIKCVAQQFGARTVETGAESIVLEMSGSKAQITAFLAATSGFGIQDVARSGSVALVN